MHKKARFVLILFVNDANQRPMVIFSIFRLSFISCVYLNSPPLAMAAFLSHYTYISNDTGWGGAGQEGANFKKSEPLIFRSNRAF